MDNGAAAIDNLVSWWSNVAFARGGHVDLSPHLAAIDGLGTNPIVNRAVVLSPDAEVAAVVAAICSTYDTRDGGVIGLLDAWDAVDLDGVDGWSRQGTVLLPEMVFSPDKTSTAAPDADADLREVTDAAGIADFDDVIRNGFDFVPWDDQPILPAALLDSASRLFVAYVDDMPVACAMGHDFAHVTGVYLVATKPEARGRGLGEAVTWAATRAFGDRPATLQASAMGTPVYARMGYVTTRQMRLWIRARSGSQ